MTVRLILSLVTVVLAVGCGHSVGVDTGVRSFSVGADKASGAPRVVAAIVDTGINPYHEFFHKGGPLYGENAPASVTPEILAEFGVDEAHILRLTRSGDLSRDYAADRAQWDAVRPGELYWVAGTNILAAGFVTFGQPQIFDSNNAESHGTSTAAALLTANPEAIILFAQGVPYPAPIREAININNYGSEQFVFGLPGVDIVSTSYTLEAHHPAQGEGVKDSRKGVLQLGKLHVTSAGNAPTPSPVSMTGGPWWAISVGGFEEYGTRGWQLLSAVLPDFVADFTQRLPSCTDCESGLTLQPGTSFSAPRAAGVASRVLLEARRLLGHDGGIREVDGNPVMAAGDSHSISNWQLRRALEEAAHVSAFADYDPAASDYSPGDSLGQSLPVPDQAPWLAVGWGELSTDPEKQVIQNALAYLGFGGDVAAKTSGFCDHQTRVIQVRKAYWDLPGSVPASDPFIYCASP